MGALAAGWKHGGFWNTKQLLEENEALRKESMMLRKLKHSQDASLAHYQRGFAGLDSQFVLVSKSQVPQRRSRQLGILCSQGLDDLAHEASLADAFATGWTIGDVPIQPQHQDPTTMATKIQDIVAGCDWLRASSRLKK